MCCVVCLRGQETVFALGGRSFLALMKEADIAERTTAENRTYFVPVDQSVPTTEDSANDVVSVRFQLDSTAFPN